MISVVLAGGRGTRLWPLSTPDRPKQLCDFFGQGSLLTMTINRLKPLGSVALICCEDQKKIVQDDIRDFNIEVLTEPMGKNTAPAIGLALSRYKTCMDDILAIFPADHYISNIESFHKTLEHAQELAGLGNLVTIGIKPVFAETGFGYIEPEQGNRNVVKAFHEKPDYLTALIYIERGFLWNSGIFIARIDTWKKLYKEFLPSLYSYIEKGTEKYLSSYSAMPNISVDYAIAEKCTQMAVVEGDFGWNDIGSWNALAAVLDNDENGNAKVGNSNIIDSRNCFAHSTHKNLILFGLDDMVVVETEQNILVCPRSRSQDIKHLIDQIN